MPVRTVVKMCFASSGASCNLRRYGLVVRTAFVATRFGYFSFRMCHNSCFSLFLISLTHPTGDPLFHFHWCFRLDVTPLDGLTNLIEDCHFLYRDVLFFAALLTQWFRTVFEKDLTDVIREGAPADVHFHH